VDFRRAALAVALLDISTDQPNSSQAWTETLTIADPFQLTVYDASYPELARPNLPLATLDRELRTAATAFGVKLSGQLSDAVSLVRLFQLKPDVCTLAFGCGPHFAAITLKI
jgi:hypothetical protein